ncbi:MAG TPA: hypothetical protein PLJ78_04635 [Anaerolineae bacterium]|nr:hypothetical protein [Anaerolineae bacterium]HQK13219.1 hypothetical protein [Anaerolineae bacterium]
MRKITMQSNQKLEWRQPNPFKMEYELRAGDELVATLRFRSSFGTLATAESADGCWTFKRVGFFQTRVTVRVCGSETDLAVFKNNTWKGGGTLILADGREYLVTTNFWQTDYGFKTAEGEPLVNFKTRMGLLHQATEVEILPAGENLPELPWMVLLGWYLAVMMYNDSTAAVMAAVAVS